MVKTVYVLGNGFDLDIGLKTSYRNFIEKLYRGNDSNVSNQLIDDMIRTYDDANWIDIESFLRDYALSYNDKELEKNRCISKEYNQLVNDLYYYMSAEKYEMRDLVNRAQYKTESSAMKLLREMSNISFDNFHIYSFNYTDLNEICDSSGIKNIDNKYITYIHGTVASSCQGTILPIIIGMDEIDVKEDFRCIIKTYNPNYKPGIIKSLQEAEHVIFFGIGFGTTDAPYFKGFFSNISEGKLSNRKIDIYTREDDCMILGKIKGMDSNINIARLKENCNMTIHHT